MKQRTLLAILLTIPFVNFSLAQSHYQPDLNGDRFINFSDFTSLAENWQKSGSSLTGDIDSSGTVDSDDLSILAGKWLQYSLVIFVDASAASGGDGSSWDNAYIYLLDAIDAADEGYEIWVAKGTYKPDSNSVFQAGTSFHTAVFQIPKGVAIYGGFPTGGSSKALRDWTNNETILSGNIGYTSKATDNSYNVVAGADDAVLDGLVIADGYASSTSSYGRGGGIRNENVIDMTIANCTFRDNYARYDGGAIYNYESSVSFSNCVFSENTCDSDGAGIYNSNTETTLINCSFFDNHCVERGGGIYNYKTPAEIINCLFTGNISDANGGAVYNSYETVEMTNCTVAENSAGKDAGGIYNMYSASVITNCIAWDNGTSIYYRSNKPAISYCDIEDCGASGTGWNTNFGTDSGNNIDSDPCFADDMSLKSTSPCINAGKNSALPTDVTTDLAGNTRFNGTVDIGAFEYE